jgi:hypothetical protein
MKVGIFSFFKREARSGEISSNVSRSSGDDDKCNCLVVFASGEIARQV